MHTTRRLRGIWSRQTLAAKLTISYTAALLFIGVVVGSFAGYGLVRELRAASAATASRVASATSLALEETIEAYHSSLLMTQVEAAVRVFAQLNPESDRSAAITYAQSQDQGALGFIYLVDEAGALVYHPQQDAELLDTATVVAAALLSETGTGFLRYEALSRQGSGTSAYHSYASRLPGWGWTVVAAEAESALFGRIPQKTLDRLLESSAPGSIAAAAVFNGEGVAVAQSAQWSIWADRALPMVELGNVGVSQVERAFGKRLRHVAYEGVPAFGVTVVVISIADYLETMLGRFVILLAGGAVFAFIVITITSRQTATLVTAPVHRAAQHIIGATATQSPQPETGDELASLVRRLLRTSVKLSYEQKHREQAEHELEITANVYRNMGEGIAIFDPDVTIMRVNPAFTSITGFSLNDVRGQHPRILLSPSSASEMVTTITAAVETNGEWVGELEIVNKAGVAIPILLSIRGVFASDGTPRHYIGVIRDIADIRTTQDRLQHLATHDPLTDLRNRTHLSESLERIVGTRRRRGGSAAVLFVDIDHFKDVNDAHGHHAGDELLQTVADRLKSAIREEDLIARFGGDEFVIVITQFEDVSSVDEVVRRMLNRVREPAVVGGITVRPSATAGIAIYPESGTTPEDLLKNADAAMYEAKRIGRGGYRFHDAGINEAVRVRLAIQDQVRFWLRTGELVLLWQPVVRAADSKVVGAEALIRRNNNGTLEPPSSFMPQIEGSRVIMELASWVLRSTAETLAAQESALPEGFRVAVNVSATEILQRDFVQLVAETLDAQRVSTSRLAVEVTEGAAIRDIPMAQSVIRDLRATGVSVYLDDFGVGYSSLQYLRELGVDAVKLDKSFLFDFPESDASCSLVRGVVEMAHGLGLGTIVEGVERPEQMHYLQSIGCDKVQGYHTGYPMPVDELIAQIASDGEDQAGSGR